MTAKIVLSNGMTIEAEKNGDCYITPAKPDFPEELGRVVITENGNRRFIEDAFLIECAAIDDRYWFTFGEPSETEKLIKNMKKENAMLEDAIAELAGIVGGDE